MSEKLVTNPVKAIKAKCMECCCYQREEVKQCPVEACALWSFRLGKNPYRAKSTREFTPEQKQKNAERLKAWRERNKRGDREED